MNLSLNLLKNALFLLKNGKSPSAEGSDPRPLWLLAPGGLPPEAEAFPVSDGDMLATLLIRVFDFIAKLH